MSVRQTLRNAACALAALVLAGCQSTPSAPSSLFTTATFTGSVARGASSTHTFTTGQNAPVVIRMTSFNPSNVTMGLALGTPVATAAGQTCNITVGQAAVEQGREFQLDLGPSTYCVMMFDIGNIPESTVFTYTIVVQYK